MLCTPWHVEVNNRPFVLPGTLKLVLVYNGAYVP